MQLIIHFPDDKKDDYKRYLVCNAIFICQVKHNHYCVFCEKNDNCKIIKLLNSLPIPANYIFIP
jgi:hypothetical protein